MLLTIDVGNTNLTLGVYQGNGSGPRWRLATVHERMPDEYGLQFIGLLQHAGFSPTDITGICLASVVPPLTGKVVDACRQYLGQEPLVVDTGVRTGVRIRYEDPKAVGADRIVDAAAVQKLYGGPACVVDFGTATTFDAISRLGRLPWGSHRSRDWDCSRGIVLAHSQVAPGGFTAPPGRHRSEYRACHAVRVVVWLRFPGRGDGRPLPQRAWARNEGYWDGRPGRNRGTRNQRDPNYRALADARWLANHLGAQSRRVGPSMESSWQFFESAQDASDFEREWRANAHHSRPKLGIPSNVTLSILTPHGNQTD